MSAISRGKLHLTKGGNILTVTADLDKLRAFIVDLESRVAFLESAADARRKIAATKVPAQRDGTGIDGQCIRAARLQAGWTQADLGRALLGEDASRGGKPTISAWECGIRKIPIGRARAIAAIFTDNGQAPPAFVFPTEKP